MRVPSHHQDVERRDDLAMTPMIDVVFLLLIFCMVTMSFTKLEGVLEQRLPQNVGQRRIGPPDDKEQRLELRQSEAKPIWDAMEKWLEEVKLRTSNVILPKSDFSQALQYIRNHFVELKRYLDDASIPIDNNETEQLMKQVALGRKNWLFAGSVAGGERTAGFLTLASSALRNDLDVWQYVKDVLDQLLAGVTEYEPLLPWNWAADHPEAIHHYRVDERKERTDRKRFKRENRRRQRSRQR